MEDLPLPLFCLTLSHSIDDIAVVNKFLEEYPDETQRCIPIALRTALESKDLPPVPFFSAKQLSDILNPLWSDMPRNVKLFFAINKNMIYLAALVLRMGVDNHTLDQGLLDAAEAGYTDIAKLLLSYGANPHVYQDKILRDAAKGRRINIAVLFDPNTGTSGYLDDVSVSTVRAGHVNTVKLLLDSKVDPHIYDDTLLMVAVNNNHFDIVRLLLDYDSGSSKYASKYFQEILQRARSKPDSELAAILRERHLI